MLEIDQNKRALELLALLEEYIIEQEELETLCEDYCGMWESLYVDMLSAEETQLLAEHLTKCEKCRKKCAMLHEAGFYEDMPFYDRIRAYEANPAAEKDEYWKSIAFAFKPELATIAVKRSLIERISAWVAAAWKSLVDEAKGALAWLDGVIARLALALNPSRRVVAFAEGDEKASTPGARRLIYSAALTLIVAAVGVIFWNPSPAPPIAGPNVGEIPGGEPGVRGIGVVKGISARPSNEGETQGSTKVSAANTNDPSANANDATAEMLKCLEFDFGSLSEVYQEGKAAFDAKDYSTAAASFDELANTLAAEEKIDVEALSVARWNLAVATIQSGDVQTGVGLLKALLDMRLDDEEMNARVNAAIKTFEK
ncbi:MAG: hypothetical protein J6K25_14470 [Thermoguttaceae bacterium]|nr:hypothetical protein [Thermoguttaceae bacterium]